jgi:hypothetical protein
LGKWKNCAGLVPAENTLAFVPLNKKLSKNDHGGL